MSRHFFYFDEVDEVLPVLDDNLIPPQLDEALPPQDEALPPQDEGLPPQDEGLPPQDGGMPPQDEQVEGSYKNYTDFIKILRKLSLK